MKYSENQKEVYKSSAINVCIFKIVLFKVQFKSIAKKLLLK